MLPGFSAELVGVALEIVYSERDVCEAHVPVVMVVVLPFTTSMTSSSEKMPKLRPKAWGLRLK